MTENLSAMSRTYVRRSIHSNRRKLSNIFYKDRHSLKTTLHCKRMPAIPKRLNRMLKQLPQAIQRIVLDLVEIFRVGVLLSKILNK